VRRLLALTCAMVLIDTVFYAALVPLVPYFTEELGLSKSTVGILSGAFGAGVLLGSGPGGYSAAQFGVRPTALVGLCLMSVASLLFGFASGTWELVVLRLAAGFGSALSWVSALTWLTEQTPEEQRGQMLGALGSAAVVGALLGPVLGSVAATVGIPLAFTLVSGGGVAVAVWAWSTPAPAAPTKGPFLGAIPALLRPRLATGLVLIAFSPLLFGVLAVLAALKLARLGWGAAAVGAVFLAAALFEAAVHPLIGRWSDKAGYRPPVLAGLLTSFAILLALPWTAAAPLVALLIVLAGGAFNAPLVPGTALLSRSAENIGISGALAFGAANFAWASGYAVGASLGGALADLGGDALSYLSLAAACLLALLLLRQVA
jgi:MFS family permease